ncbi:MAG: glycosyltransferase family 1 protein, partial [Deltaproteobacteria bacterium]|nr:glycosyltransferase family 1 protein [Deltaproteobacteria bacterium]
MILACEPICIGFEHSMVNAAMLSVFKDAYPDEELIFTAEEEHLRLVAQDPGIANREGLTFQALPLPLRKASSAERFETGIRMVRSLFSSAERGKASLVVFTCIDGEMLHAIKMLLGESPGLRCVVALHGILSSVGKSPSLLPWKNRHLF